MRRLLSIATVVAMSCGGAAIAETISYFNDFDSAGLPNPSPASAWSHDAVNGEWDIDITNPSSSTVVQSSEEFTNLAGKGFEVRTRFTLTDLENPSSGSFGSVGFGVLSPTAAFSSSNAYYLVDWGMNNSATSGGAIRILDHGGSGTTAVNSSVPGSDVVIGNEYELVFTAKPNGASLDMTFRVLDGSGNQLGGTATATDASPNAGNYIGYRSRLPRSTSKTTETLQVDFDYFSIREVPEPCTAFLALSLGLCGVAGRRRCA